ncbi:protein TolR [Rhodospirillaceae bacterium SYSU D60014]|uniref:protein TolR n=1 Tax=Virgifigura deserti TaxID=2268457 RepID=UPI000E6690DE
MAVSLKGGGGGGSRRFHRKGGYRPMSEINVTPLVDVMLVLLIVFMVTAPLLTAGIPVNLPQTKADVLSDPQEPLVITVDAAGKVFIQETEIELDSLVARLAAITQNKVDTRIFLRGDRGIAYGRIMEVMGTITSAGFTQVALIAERPPEQAAALTATD